MQLSKYMFFLNLFSLASYSLLNHFHSFLPKFESAFAKVTMKVSWGKNLKNEKVESYKKMRSCFFFIWVLPQILRIRPRRTHPHRQKLISSHPQHTHTLEHTPTCTPMHAPSHTHTHPCVHAQCTHTHTHSQILVIELFQSRSGILDFPQEFLQPWLPFSRVRWLGGMLSGMIGSSVW